MTSTTARIASGAIAKKTSARWRSLNSDTVENITTPSSASAATLSSVWDTIVPTTVGRFSRGRPVRRATISARDGSPSLAGRVADMRTPMKVPWSASTGRSGDCGSAARRIACHATPRTAIERHISPSATTTHQGVAATRLWPIWSRPIRCRASQDSAAPPTAAIAIAARRAKTRAGERASGGLGSRLGRRCGRTSGCPSAGIDPRNTRVRSRDVAGAGIATASS